MQQRGHRVITSSRDAMSRFFLITGAAAGLLLLAGAAVAGAALAGAADESAAATRSAHRCPPSPPAIVDLVISRPYSDAIGSTSDVATAARHGTEAAPLKSWLQHVVRAADRRDAACALSLLQAWAEGGALLGIMRSKQAEYERNWAMTGAALAYLKVRAAASPGSRAAIEPWLAELARRALAFQSAAGRKRNNHWYWLGLGLAAVASATDRPETWQQARAIFADAMRDVTDDGFLPLELARGRRALHYHDFSLMALVPLAELAARRGEDWYGSHGGALHRLVAATLAGLADQRDFDRLAGVTQERPAAAGTGWMALYGARFPERIAVALPASRPGHRWLGGDVSKLPRTLAR